MMWLFLSQIEIPPKFLMAKIPYVMSENCRLITNPTSTCTVVQGVGGNVSTANACAQALIVLGK